MWVKNAKKRRIDLIMVLIWPLIATALSFIFKPNTFFAIIIFLVIPTFYLLIHSKWMYILKSIIFSAIIGIPTMIWIDYISHFNKQWIVPDTIFPFKLFGLVPIENVIWAFFTVLFIVVFYEYFLEKHATHEIWGSKMKYLLLFLVFIFGVFLVFLFVAPGLLKIPYFYLIWGIVLLLIPTILQIATFHKTLPKLFLTTAYFFYLHFLCEITGLKLGWWTFPSTQFIGMVSIFGTTFPIEEVIFWFFLLALSILTAFKFFEDEEKD